MSDNLLKTRRPAEIIELDGKRRVSTFAFNGDAVLSYLISKASWVTVEELARVVYGRNTDDSRRKIRNRIPGFRTEMLVKGIVVISEYHQRSTARIKIFDPSSSVDAACAEQWAEGALKRKEISAEKFERIMALIPDAQEVDAEH